MVIANSETKVEGAIGKKMLRAVHLCSFSFYLAFCGPSERQAEIDYFTKWFLERVRGAVLLRASRKRIKSAIVLGAVALKAVLAHSEYTTPGPYLALGRPFKPQLCNACLARRRIPLRPKPTWFGTTFRPLSAPLRYARAQR